MLIKHFKSYLIFILVIQIQNPVNPVKLNWTRKFKVERFNWGKLMEYKMIAQLLGFEAVFHKKIKLVLGYFLSWPVDFVKRSTCYFATITRFRNQRDWSSRIFIQKKWRTSLKIFLLLNIKVVRLCQNMINILTSIWMVLQQEIITNLYVVHIKSTHFILVFGCEKIPIKLITFQINTQLLKSFLKC